MPHAPTPSAAGDPTSWLPPAPEELQGLLPQYEISALIGRGGMGAVYRGMQRNLDRAVAIKILPPGLDDTDATFSERFRNEALAMAKMNHPGLVAVYDFGKTANGMLYIVMEFVDGTDVAHMMTKSGRLPSEHAMAITAHVCDALKYAHERGIVHRDIKPANIMVGYDGVVKVADFGLAKMDQSGQSTGLTQSGMAMGTLHYIAPEALMLGASVDQRADIYAMGVMLYHMLTGGLPHGLFEPPSLQVPGLDPRYDAIIARALRNDRERRYQNVGELRKDLDAIITRPVVQVHANAAKAPAALNTSARPQRSAAQPQRAPQQHMPPPPPPPRQNIDLSFWAPVVGVVILCAGIVIAAKRTRPEARAQQEAAAPAPENTQPIEPGFTPLLDDEHKDGWKYSGNGGFKAGKDDFTVWNAPSSTCGMFWYASRTYSDFILRLEFKVSSMETNSGVFLRLHPLPDAPLPLRFPNSYEFEIKGLETGAIPWSKFKPDTTPQLKLNRWNEYEITATGQDYAVRLNGVLINTFKGEGSLAGYIGIQSFAPAGMFHFRNVRIRELQPEARSEVVSFGGHRYQLVAESLSWDGAKSKAEQMGGHLATITSAEENQRIIDLVRPHLTSLWSGCWLGAVRRGTGSDWKWVTGEKFEFHNWHPGEPNAGVSTASLAIWRPDLKTSVINWNDTHFSNALDVCNRGFVVEWDDDGGKPAAAEPAIRVFISRAPQILNEVLAPLQENPQLRLRPSAESMRDELIAEGRAQPAASLDAYRAAHGLCVALLSAMDERETARSEPAWAARTQALRPVLEGLQARARQLLSTAP